MSDEAEIAAVALAGDVDAVEGERRAGRERAKERRRGGYVP